jgi:hypothetical protein
MISSDYWRFFLSAEYAVFFTVGEYYALPKCGLHPLITLKPAKNVTNPWGRWLKKSTAPPLRRLLAVFENNQGC